MLLEFILSRFREVSRLDPNDQTKNNGWYRRKYLREGVNKRMQALQAASPTFSKPVSFFHLPRLHVLRSLVAVLFFFYFILFCQAHFFMLRGSESIHRKAVAAATVAVMHATVRRVHTGVCAHHPSLVVIL